MIVKALILDCNQSGDDIGRYLLKGDRDTVFRRIQLFDIVAVFIDDFCRDRIIIKVNERILLQKCR